MATIAAPKGIGVGLCLRKERDYGLSFPGEIRVDSHNTMDLLRKPDERVRFSLARRLHHDFGQGLPPQQGEHGRRWEATRRRFSDFGTAGIAIVAIMRKEDPKNAARLDRA